MAVIVGNFIALDDGTLLTPPPAAPPPSTVAPPPALVAPAPPPTPAAVAPSVVLPAPASSPPVLAAAVDSGPQDLAVPGARVLTGSPFLGGETVTAPVPTVEAQAAGVTTVPSGAEAGGVPTPGDADEANAAAIANANDPDLGDLPGWDLIDPFGVTEFAVTNQPLKGEAAITVMAQACADYGIDPRACVANALHEGPGGGIGDQGAAYGPFQVHATDGRLPQFDGKGPSSDVVNAWAWSENGIRYAVRSMAAGKPSARGLQGHPAVYAIVYGFERPKDEAGAYSTRRDEYDKLVALGAGWVAYAAPKLAGPAAGGATATPPSSSGPLSLPYKPAGVSAQWDNVWDFFLTTVPKQHDKVDSFAKSLMGAVK